MRFSVLLLAVAGLVCKNQVTTQELLDANFLAKGQTPIDLLTPSENQQVTTANPTLSWSSKGVSLYTFELATDSAFTRVVLKKDVAGTTYVVANSDLNGVSSLTTGSYYWRVKIALIAHNLQSKTGTFFLVAMPANGSGYAGALYVNVASAGNVQVGSKEAPYRRIQTAIITADALRNYLNAIQIDILVAQGTYAEEIDLIPGISIRGGYLPDDWSRNIATNSTTMQAPFDRAINGNPSVTNAYTSTTNVDGFTIQGGNASRSYGIYLTGSSPTLSNNIIAGGAAANDSYGIYIDSASPIISNNIIIGGPATSGTSYGIHVFSASPTISNNVIFSGAAGSFSNPLSLASASPIVSNNTLIVGPAGVNNFGINLGNGCTPTISNNSIYTTGKTGLRYGINETFPSDNPIAVKNNTFFDIGTGGAFYPYRDADGICSGSPGNACTAVTNMETDLNAEAAGMASGNVNQNPNFTNFPTKVDVTRDGSDAGAIYDGTATTLEIANCTDYVVNEFLEYDKDGVARQITACSTATGSGVVTFTPALSSPSVITREIRLWGTNNTNLVIDLHLKATSPCDVRQGGLDLSSLFTTDRDNLTRTATLTCGPANAGATGWSIGAYEY